MDQLTEKQLCAKEYIKSGRHKPEMLQQFLSDDPSFEPKTTDKKQFGTNSLAKAGPTWNRKLEVYVLEALLKVKKTGINVLDSSFWSTLVFSNTKLRGVTGDDCKDRFITYLFKNVAKYLSAEEANKISAVFVPFCKALQSNEIVSREKICGITEKTTDPNKDESHLHEGVTNDCKSGAKKKEELVLRSSSSRRILAKAKQHLLMSTDRYSGKRSCTLSENYIKLKKFKSDDTKECNENAVLHEFSEEKLMKTDKPNTSGEISKLPTAVVSEILNELEEEKQKKTNSTVAEKCIVHGATENKKGKERAALEQEVQKNLEEVEENLRAHYPNMLIVYQSIMEICAAAFEKILKETKHELTVDENAVRIGDDKSKWLRYVVSKVYKKRSEDANLSKLAITVIKFSIICKSYEKLLKMTQSSK